MGKIVMTNTNNNSWILWWSITIFVALSTVVYFIATHTTKVELTLIKGEKVNIQLFRLTPENISMFMSFSKTTGEDRPELGNYSVKVDRRKTGIREYPNPGEPVKLLVSDTEQNYTYEAMPASGYGANSITRGLILYKDDNNPYQFPTWGVRTEKQFSLNPGFNEFQITVLEVGNSLEGEPITLYIRPPLSFKFSSYGLIYQFLWYFHFWRIYFLILLVWFLVLVARKKRIKHI